MADVVGFFKKVAPWVAAAAASALPGPIGMAAKVVANAIGKPVRADVGEIAAAVAGATPEQLAAIQSADHQFQLDMQKLGFQHEGELAQAAYADRADARAREVSVRDRMPMFLAIFVTLGFFGLVGLLAFHAFPDKTRDVFMILIGALTVGWKDVMGYYFGSSAGSDAKNAIISNLSAGGGS
jgi:hypothetical protein